MQTCTPTLVSLGKIVHGGKHRAMPSLYRDYLLAKVGDQWPVLRQATPTKFYRRAVSKNVNEIIGLAPYLDKFLVTTIFCGTLTEKLSLIWLRDSFV